MLQQFTIQHDLKCMSAHANVHVSERWRNIKIIIYHNSLNCNVHALHAVTERLTQRMMMKWPSTGRVLSSLQSALTLIHCASSKRQWKVFFQTLCSISSFQHICPYRTCIHSIPLCWGRIFPAAHSLLFASQHNIF